MLVLTRKRGEIVLIGDAIQVKVLLIDRNKVRIGIEAPADIVIQRSELCARCVPVPIAAPAARNAKPQRRRTAGSRSADAR